MAKRRTTSKKKAARAAPGAPPPPSVAELLAESRAAHTQYRQHLPRMHGQAGQVQELAGDVAAARVALERAGTLRKAAHEADPKHTDPAWVSDAAAVGDHDSLMTFYAEALAAFPEP